MVCSFVCIFLLFSLLELFWLKYDDDDDDADDDDDDDDYLLITDCLFVRFMGSG